MSWDLQGSKLQGIITPENQGIALCQDFALLKECKHGVLKTHTHTHTHTYACVGFPVGPRFSGFEPLAC